MQSIKLVGLKEVTDGMRGSNIVSINESIRINPGNIEDVIENDSIGRNSIGRFEKQDTDEGIRMLKEWRRSEIAGILANKDITDVQRRDEIAETRRKFNEARRIYEEESSIEAAEESSKLGTVNSIKSAGVGQYKRRLVRR